MAANFQNNRLIYRQFDHAVEGILEQILRANPQSVCRFFMPYDAHEKRILTQWELELIFGRGIDVSAFEQVHLRNQETTRLLKGEVELQFLVTACEKSVKMPISMYKEPLPSDSLYMHKQVNDECERNLIQLSMHADVRYDAAQAFSLLFNSQTQVDLKLCEQSFQKHNINIMNKAALNDLVNYFKQSQDRTYFTKIEFTQGIAPWVQQKRPSALQSAEVDPLTKEPVQYDQWERRIVKDSYGRPLHFATNGQPIQYDQYNNLMFEPLVFDSRRKPLKVDLKGNLILQTQDLRTTQQPLDTQLPQEPPMSGTVFQHKDKVDYTKNCTYTAENHQVTKPVGFTPHSQSYQIDEIIKGCCVREKLVFDYFDRYATQGFLKLQQFEAAVSALKPSWPALRNRELFDQFDLVMNGRQQGQLSTKDIDAYVHFSAQKSLEQLHQEVLLLIDENRNKAQKPEEVFFQICRGNLFCTPDDFRDSLSMLNSRLGDLDCSFVMKRYWISDTQYDYKKFLEDLGKAIFSQFSQETTAAHQMNTAKIVEAVLKRLFTLNKQMTPYLTIIYGDRPLSQTDFVEAIGTKLKLVPEICTDRLIIEIYAQLSAKNTRMVSIFDIGQYFEQAITKTEVQMKDEILETLRQRQQFAVVNSIFEQNSNYQRTKKMILADFENILVNQLGFKRLDAEFVATFFKQGDVADASSFLGALSGAGNSQNQVKITVPKQQLSSQQRGSLQNLQQFLASKKLESEFIKMLRSNSIGSLEFISFNSLRSVLIQIYKKYQVTPLSDYMIKDLLNVLVKDQSGDFNWHQLIGLCFGENKAQLLLNQAIAAEPARSQAQQDGKPASKAVILTDEQLRLCQDLLCQTKKDITARQKTPEEIFEPLRQPGKKSINPKNFVATLKEVVTPATKARFQNLNNDFMRLMIFYLIREVPKEVSYTKLYNALNLPETQAPLKQDGISSELNYRAKLSRQLIDTNKVPLSVIELQTFMQRSNMTLETLLGVPATATEMAVTDFEAALSKCGYETRISGELKKALQTPELGPNKVSLTVLTKHLTSIPTPKATQVKIGKMSQETRTKLSQISDFLQLNQISLDEFHRQLDTNQDDRVDMEEFITGVLKIGLSTRLTREDLTEMFKAIDINRDQHISVNEFSLFLKGATLKRDQRINRLDPTIKAAVDQDCKELYQIMTRLSEQIDANGILKTMQGIGAHISTEQAQDMIKRVDADGDGKISEKEFMTIMQPIIMDQYINSDQQVEDLRALFRDADTDLSGYLTIDEFYVAMLRMGAEVSRPEIVAYFSEFDINGDMQVDIDEFIAIMTNGCAINFSDEKSIETHLKIKKARQISPLEFLKAFNNLPVSYTPSFLSERWVKTKRNLPSSVFQVQIDQRTLLWKDLLPVQTEQLSKDQLSAENRPFIKSTPSQLCAQIHIEGAEGIPLPPKDSNHRENLVKRCVRVALFDKVKQDFIYNSSHVIAEWSAKQTDIWSFKDTNSLNPLLFRSTEEDDLNRKEIVFIFELVVYVKSGGNQQDFCCGWAEAPLSMCEKSNTKIKLLVRGGTPQSAVNIAKEDIDSKRSGVKGLMKVFNNNITSVLTVSFKPQSTIEAEVRPHLEMMPSTCLLPKSMIYILSGYRNYIGKKLLGQNQVGILKKPAGDVIISCMPKILDCPDVLETLIHVWDSDYSKTLTKQHKSSIEYLIREMKDIVSRIYPVFYSVEFDHQQKNFFQSMCADPAKLALRQQLVRSALRHNNPQVKSKSEKIESLTSFRPFNVKELNYEVYDDSEAKFDQILSHYEDIGIISKDPPGPAGSSPAAGIGAAPKINVPQVN